MTAGRVGIVGAGISGVHLALRLQQLGVPATVYSAQTPEQVRAARPRNFPARFGRTQQREATLGVAHWGGPDSIVRDWELRVRADPPLAFRAVLDTPSSGVDFRIYLPRLLAEFADRGGGVRFRVDPVAELAARHDLVVVANGDRSMASLFPVDPERSPYAGPQRVLCAGLYRGIGRDAPNTLDIHFLPGLGEILRLPFHTAAGLQNVVAFEAVPGGPLAGIAGVDPLADPAAFTRAVLDLLATYAPEVRARADGDFGLLGPGEVAQGGVTPAVRRGWARLDDRVGALAIGDAWIVNDPLSAQGANLGSHTAFALAEIVAATDPPWDEAFCRATSTRLWEHAGPVTEWSNAFLRPPPPHVLGLFTAAAGTPAVADAFVSRFDDPVGMWRTLSAPAGVAAFLAEHCAPAAPA